MKTQNWRLISFDLFLTLLDLLGSNFKPATTKDIIVIKKRPGDLISTDLFRSFVGTRNEGKWMSV